MNMFTRSAISDHVDQVLKTDQDIYFTSICAGEGSEVFAWSAGIRLQPFLEQADTEQGRVARQVSCANRRNTNLSWRFNVGVSKEAELSGTA